jgi:N6-L-threonylcarbamoyladenine synthase
VLKKMIVLGIESTCDETACAIVKDGKDILSNIIHSQSEMHSPFGGVFPELACRRHVDAIIPVIRDAMMHAHVSKNEIDLIAVSKGPGLIGALLIGLNVAKALSMAWDIPFIGINHVEAHLYAAIMPLESPPFPALGIVISGGHTFMVKMRGIGSYEGIGTTQDDAIGEAFDKVASLLHLPYPGGPAIEQLAKQGNPSRFSFRPANVKGRPWDFSFSGLKTNVLYALC